MGILRELVQVARYVAADDKDKAANQLAQEEIAWQAYLDRKDAELERLFKSIASPFVK